MNTKCFHHIFPTFTFSLCPPPPPTGTYPQTGFTSLSFIFFKRHFCHFVIVIHGVSLGHFHVNVLYSELAHSLHYSPFYPSPLLLVTSTGFSVPYLYLYRKHINHIHPLNFLVYPPPPTGDLPLI
jgi:hypothetical protein